MSINFVIPEFHIGGEGVPTFQFYKKGFRLGGSVSPTWQDIILSGVGSLTLVNAKKNGLNYLKLFGGTEFVPETYIDSVTAEGKCEQSGTPTPSQPVDIVCNNGVIKARMASGLPLGYTRVQFINSTRKIELANKTTNNSEIEARFKRTNTNSQYIYQSDSSSSLSTNTTAYLTSANGNWRFGAQTALVANDDFPIGEYVVTVQNKDGVFINGEQEYTYTNVNTFTSTNNLGAFGTQATPPADLDYIIHRENGVVIAYYIACRRNSDNALGLYDLIGNTFYTNDEATITAGADNDSIEIYTDGTTETVTDSNGLTATCQRLLSVGDYKDTQEILSGAVTRNVGIFVLDGTETWTKSSTYTGSFYTTGISLSDGAKVANNPNIYCTHGFKVNDLGSYASAGIGACYWYSAPTINYKYEDGTATVEQFKQWLTDQYNAGTPVTIVYPLATATTESVAGQLLTKAPVTYAGSISGLTGTTVTSSHTVPTPTNPLDINCNNGVIKSTKNVFDGMYEAGIYSTANGNAISAENRVRGKNPIMVESRKVYRVSSPDNINLYDMRWLFYDSNDTFISAKTTDTATATTPANAKYIRFYLAANYSVSTAPRLQIEKGSTTTYRPYGSIYTNGTQEKVEVDTTGDYALAEMLLKVGDYQDVQSVLDGNITRNVGVKVLDGTEDWVAGGTIGENSWRFSGIGITSVTSGADVSLCTHIDRIIQTSSTSQSDRPCIRFTSGGSSQFYPTDNSMTLAEWKQFLSDQYQAGKPVIVIYPLATATTESVTPQPLSTQEGTNIVEITEASMTNLPLEVSYKAGVTVTIEEVENAQLDNSVEVTIS